MERLLIILAFAASAKEILVIYDTSDIKNTHSQYFGDLTAQGNKLTYKFADSMGLKIEKYDEYLYSSIILLCPSTEGII